MRDVILENQLGFSRGKKRGYLRKHRRPGGPYASPFAHLRPKRPEREERFDRGGKRTGRERLS